MLWLYNTGILLYGLIVKIFSLFNTKAALFIKGHANIFEVIQNRIDPSYPHVWFHFASLGEFEQGRPVLERIKSKYPAKRIVITFFSPSGYEIRKNYDLADGVFYLPLDTAGNARRFIELVNPELVIFTKYEYWYHYFNQLNKKNIPLYIISGIFRPNQIFFKWYGNFHRKILGLVSHFFLQNGQSRELLKGIGYTNTSISGDTRFDRVVANANNPKRIEIIETFCGLAPILIAGSTWPKDEQLLTGMISKYPEWKFIIAPHEINQDHIQEVQKLVPKAIKYSDLIRSKNFENMLSNAQTLIIDNIGMLSALYQYGKIAYIGGGFGAGIHNILEAAAFGLPIIMGPKYDKFQEAKDLVSIGAARSISSEEELIRAFSHFKENESFRAIAKAYVEKNKGATEKILEMIATVS